MKIKLTSVFVDNQQKALAFYTGVLGFVAKQNIPMGEFSFLTVVSPEEIDGTEVLLEPNENPAASTFQKALFEQGIPLTAFQVDNIQQEYDRLVALDVEFKTPPTPMGPAIVATFNDTCGNLIQIYQV